MINNSALFCSWALAVVLLLNFTLRSANAQAPPPLSFTCPAGYFGYPNCDSECDLIDSYPCGLGRGAVCDPVDGCLCIVQPLRQGTDCDMPCACATLAVCTTAGRCVCDLHVWGADCGIACPGFFDSGADCSGHGACNGKYFSSSPTCTCERGFSGAACNVTNTVSLSASLSHTPTLSRSQDTASLTGSASATWSATIASATLSVSVTGGSNSGTVTDTRRTESKTWPTSTQTRPTQSNTAQTPSVTDPTTPTGTNSIETVSRTTTGSLTATHLHSATRTFPVILSLSVTSSARSNSLSDQPTVTFDSLTHTVSFGTIDATASTSLTFGTPSTSSTLTVSAIVKRFLNPQANATQWPQYCAIAPNAKLEFTSTTARQLADAASLPFVAQQAALIDAAVTMSWRTGVTAVLEALLLVFGISVV